MALDWILNTLGSGAVAALLLSVVGYLSRTQLTHWLNKDIEAIKAKFQQDLAERQAGYQRELAAYNASLIVSNEQTRATQEVRKVAALKIAELEFEAVSALHRATRGFASDAVAIYRVPSSGIDDHMRLRARLDALRQAQLDVELFLSHEQVGCLIRYRHAMTNMVQAAFASSRQPLGATFEKQEAELIRLELEVDASIKEKLTALRDLS